MTKSAIPPKQAASSRFGVLLTTSLVSSLIMLDSNIVAVSLPAIGRTFNSSFTELEWVISAYLLSYAALLMAAGAFADLCGRRKAMILGLVVFAVASSLCGLATSSLMLNLARAAQGIGGSLLLTAALAIISNTFVGAERARAFAVWGACLGIALTSGPIVGGIITSFFGWRWVFLVNIPICIGLIVATIRLIDESRDVDAERLDFLGIATFSPGLFLLIWALMEGNDEGWSSTTILLRFVGFIVCVLAFVAVELWQRRPMIDFALFRRPTFVGAVVAMMGYGATAQVMIFYLPLFLQNSYDFSAAEAGLAMLPFALPMVLVPRFSAKLVKSISGRMILTVGLATTLIGNLLFWLLAGTGQPYGLFVIGLLVAGTGAGLLNGETVKVLAAAVPAERAGMASGISSTTRFIGVLVGVAGLGAILTDVARSHFLSAAGAAGLNTAMSSVAARQVVSGNLMGMLDNVPDALQVPLHTAALAAYGSGFALASLVAAAVSGIACFLTYTLILPSDTAPIPVAAPEPEPCLVPGE